MLQIHSRELAAQRAAASFNIGFLDTVSDETDFAVIFQAINTLVACVTANMVDDAPPLEWPGKEGSPKYAFKAGQVLAAIAVEGNLTHGEMLLALHDAQASLIKSLIRSERHPNNPDMPGGLADSNETSTPRQRA